MTYTPQINVNYDLVTVRSDGTVWGYKGIPGTFESIKANDFIGRIATGSLTHAEMDNWQWLEFTSLHHGIGARKLMDDTALYLTHDTGINAAIAGKIKLAAKWVTSDAAFNANAFMDFGDYTHAGGDTSIRYYNPATDLWANGATGLGAAVVGFENYNAVLYAALGDSVDMQKCVAAASPATWAAEAGKKARCLKKWKTKLWFGYTYDLYNYDGTTWSAAIKCGDPKTLVLGLSVHDSLLVVAKEEGMYVSSDGSNFSPVQMDLPVYAGNFKMRSLQGWLWHNVLSSVQRIGGLTGEAALQVLTPVHIDDDTYGWGIPVGIANNSRYAFVLFNNAENTYPIALLHNGEGWHPLWKGANATTAKSIYYSRVSGRLFINNGSTHAQKWGTLNDEQANDFDTTAGYTIDLLHIDGRLAEITKALRSMHLVGKNISATKKVELYYRVDGATSWTLADTATAYPESKLSLDGVVGAITGKDAELRLKLYTDSATVSPEINEIYLSFLPRPDTILTFTQEIEAGDYLTTLDDDTDPHTTAEILSEMRALVNAKAPVTVYTMDGLVHKAYCTGVKWQEVTKEEQNA